MGEKKKNRVDAVIDEVLESKRVKQASMGLLKLLRLLSLVAIVFLVVTFILMIFADRGKLDEVFILTGISLAIFLVVNYFINKNSR